MNTRLLLLAPLLWIAACTTLPPADPPKPAAIPDAWRSPLPHGGSTAALNAWWQSFDDKQLAGLIERAQAQSPTLAQAAARRRQAEAGAAQARAALLPELTANAQAQRGRNAGAVAGTATTASATVNASWEIDLFGGQRAAAAAANAESIATTADWHAARVSLAADVAQAYVQLRLAQAREEATTLDTRFAEQIAAWARQQYNAGLMSASDAAILNTERAAAALNRSLWQAEAQIALQTLALLCGERADTLATELAPPDISTEGFDLRRKQPRVPAFDVSALPAQLLAQRPDLTAAHQRWIAAVQQQRRVEAQRWPQLSLAALVGETRLRLGGGTSNATMWAFGPSLSLPLFDGGLRAARSDAAQAAADEAAATLQARWQTAVAEVEEALQRVASGGAREREVDAVSKEWEGIARRSYTQQQAGLQSGIQRNATFRNALTAYDVVVSVRAENALAWIRLYRTLGGGWKSDNPSPGLAALNAGQPSRSP